MHQHPRPPPVTASPANSERTNPTRTNNQRDRTAQGSGTSEASDTNPPEQSSNAMSKLDQIVQNFHTKAALIILRARVELSPAIGKTTNSKRVNKWFNTDIEETEDYREQILPWKTCDTTNNRPPPLVIEVYIDRKELANNQCVVILDEQGKRWDVKEALTSSVNPRTAGHTSPDFDEVVLERWTVELGENRTRSTQDLNVALPAVYKKGIVLFRSLFTQTRLLPVHNQSRRFGFLGPHNQLKLKYRLTDGSSSGRRTTFDSLSIPLCPSQDKAVEHFSFGDTDSPAGPISLQVDYRTNCNFTVEDSEALLSSRLMGADDEFFKPSLPREQPSRLRSAEVGSLPVRQELQRPDRSQAYGSLSTFHQIGPTTGSSPISALRNVQSPGPESPPQRIGPSLRSSTSSKASFRPEAPGVARRPSVSFQPFKGPTLSASPVPSLGSSPRLSTGRVPALSTLNEARGAPSTQGPTMPSAARRPPEQAIASSTSSSPKPAPIARYSSSFSHRRARPSSGGTTKVEEDQNSSGKTSTASSAQPGSGLMAEAAGGSSGSVQEDDEKISDFLKMLDTKKDLLTPTSPAGVEASTKRTSAALTRFHRMRDSNAALSESMSSSLMLHRSSSSSSRQLSSVPPMVAATSVSTSSSPGKPISPHTPHTPAIPSRLSANSIIDYTQPDPNDNSGRIPVDSRDARSDAATSEGTTTDANANAGAIDIPTSPRPFSAAYRRSSSLAHRRAANGEDELGDPYGMRSASVGAEERQLPSVSTLGRPAEESPEDDIEGERRRQKSRESPRRPPATERHSSTSYRNRPAQNAPTGDGYNSASGSASGSSSTHQVYRSRFARGSGRGHASQASTSSLAVGGERPDSAGSESWNRRGNRASFSRPDSRFDEEEPFLFAMSDLGGVGGHSNSSRRSLEEPHGESALNARRGGGYSRRGGSGSGSGGNYAAWP